MAIIKHGALVADIRGKVGDNVFSRSQGGPTVRSVGTWIQPDTAAQVATRDALADLAAAWSATLTAAERSSWTDYAHTNPRPNRWGTPTMTSGYLCFIRHNFHSYRHAAAIQFLSAPSSPGIHPPCLAITVQQAGGLTVTGALTPDATGEYHLDGLYGGKHSWRRADGAYFVWWSTSWGVWMMTTAKGLLTSGYWARTGQPLGNFPAGGGYSGTATSAWSYNSSLAKFTFPPSNYPSPPANLQLYTYSGRPIKEGAAYYNGPWRALRVFAPTIPATAGSTIIEWTWPVHATAPPYAWTVDGSDTARAYAIAQDMATGARSTPHIITPTFASVGAI